MLRIDTMCRIECNKSQVLAQCNNNLAQCVSAQMAQCVSAQMGQCVSAQMAQCVSAQMGQCVSAQMAQCVITTIARTGTVCQLAMHIVHSAHAAQCANLPLCIKVFCK